MRMTDRVQIDAEPADPHRPYTHLLPLVQGLIDHGNPLARPTASGDLFVPSQGGWVAYLSKPLDWQWVQETFALPDLVRYDRGDDEIFDHKNWVSILGSQT
jgi:hypothetical protein